MNVFAFELKRLARSIAIGCAVMAAIVIFFVVGAFPAYRDAEAQVTDMLASYPPEFLTAFGIEGDIFSFGGFYSFTYLYSALAAAIMAAIWGLTVFGREKQGRCEEFLLTLPASRGTVFAGKLGACLVGVAALAATAVAASLFAWSAVDEPDVAAGRVALAALGLAGVALVFLAAGCAGASLSRRIRSASGTATGLGIAGFVLYSLPDLLDEEKLAWLSPFSWFSPKGVFGNGAFDGGYVAFAAAVAVALIAVSWMWTIRSDTRSM